MSCECTGSSLNGDNLCQFVEEELTSERGGEDEYLSSSEAVLFSHIAPCGCQRSRSIFVLKLLRLSSSANQRQIHSPDSDPSTVLNLSSAQSEALGNRHFPLTGVLVVAPRVLYQYWRTRRLGRLRYTEALLIHHRGLCSFLGLIFLAIVSQD